MSAISKLTKLQNKVSRVEETLIPLRELAAKLREDVRKQEETFAYTDRQETSTMEINIGLVKLDISSSTLLRIVDNKIGELMKPLEEERKILSSVEALLKEKTGE